MDSLSASREKFEAYEIVMRERQVEGEEAEIRGVRVASDSRGPYTKQRAEEQGRREVRRGLRGNERHMSRRPQESELEREEMERRRSIALKIEEGPSGVIERNARRRREERRAGVRLVAYRGTDENSEAG